MSEKPRIAVVIGSTRPGRAGEAVGKWVSEQAARRDDATFEVVDLADFDLPLLSEPTVPGAAGGSYERPETTAWAAAVKDFDGYVWVTPEYNHGVPAAMKNAFDVLYVEWNHKAVGFVAYGVDGGVRAVEHWRSIVANAMMVAVRAQLSLSLFTDWNDTGFAPSARRVGELNGMLGQLVAMAGAVKVLRAR